MLGMDATSAGAGLYGRVFDELPIGAAVLRLDVPEDPGSWRVVALNPAARRLARAESLGSDLTRACREAQLTGEERVLPDWPGSKPGARLSLRVFALGGPLVGILYEDVTARRTAQDSLARSNSDLTQFAFAAAHDLQAPLRKAAAFADQLRARLAGRLDASEADFLARLLKSLAGMQSLIAGLLALARVGAGGAPPQDVPLTPVAAEVAADLDETIKACGGTVKIDSLPSVHADPVQVRQLLQNLIGNALKFRLPDKPPTVRVYGRERPDGKAEIFVADDGVGFDGAQAGRLFQPFTTLHSRKDYPGSGIGLALCRAIAARHGGEISVESVVGAGAVFKVVLPGGGASWNNA